MVQEFFQTIGKNYVTTHSYSSIFYSKYVHFDKFEQVWKWVQIQRQNTWYREKEKKKFSRKVLNFSFFCIFDNKIFCSFFISKQSSRAITSRTIFFKIRTRLSRMFTIIVPKIEKLCEIYFFSKIRNFHDLFGYRYY